MKVTAVILMGFGRTIVTVACGESSSQPSAVDPPPATAEPTRSDTPTMPSATATPATAPPPTTEAPVESTPVASEPPQDPRFYQPPVLSAGGAIAAEIRSTANPSADPSIVEFRLVEFSDGPFIETTVVHLEVSVQGTRITHTRNHVSRSERPARNGPTRAPYNNDQLPLSGFVIFERLAMSWWSTSRNS